jgi:putative PIN family toxin of toxin-antitoxin system
VSPNVVVVDTNVLVAGLISTDARSPVVRIVDAMLDGRLVYLLSPALLDEYRDALLRPKIVRLHGLTEGEIDVVLGDIVANAMWREPADAMTTRASPDPNDDHLWALLASHAHSTLISGDRLLLANPPPDASVVSPRTWGDRFARA